MQSSRIGCETGATALSQRTAVESIDKNGNEVRLALKPFDISLGGNNVCVQSSYVFKNTGEIYLRKKILHADRTDIDYKIAETFNGGYGRTEYPEDIAGVKLYAVDRAGEGCTIEYEYLNRKATVSNAKCVGADIPMLNCKIEFNCDSEGVTGNISEGSMFSPSYSFKLTQTLRVGEESNICLAIKK